ncbi:MAG: D-alanyl-D-alanine carboxypeptidase [Lachnospiraceae bacterium]|nr:D-alanyl-D-alanine carboxypeptidase [Lachnospiraceae bacterium]
MKCINKTLFCVLFLLCLIQTGCGSSFAQPYRDNKEDVSFRLFQKNAYNSQIADSFASGLCVADADAAQAQPIQTDALSAALFDVTRCNTVYADSVYERVNPASLTKIMTALVALKYAEPDMVLTASSSIYNLESGAQKCGLAAGDTMTLDQALRILLVYSANDVAIMIAENIGGSVEGFLSMMNAEASRIGATGTNFTNSSGLSDAEHYSTAYDMYLIFSEALKYDLFTEIINMPSYSTVYRDSSGNEKKIDVKSTNYYLRGEKSAPAGITVIGGKTGTTTAAGHCLILLTRDIGSKPYISVVMRASSNDTLYATMNELLYRVPN